MGDLVPAGGGTAGGRLRTGHRPRDRLLVLSAIAAGAVLVVTGFAKAVDAEGFARAMQHQAVIPAALVAWVAAVLPWFEVVTGIALGWRPTRRIAAWYACGLFALFGVYSLGEMAAGSRTACPCLGALSAYFTLATGARVVLDAILALLCARVASSARGASPAEHHGTARAADLR